MLVDFSAALLKERLQLRRVERSIVFLIQFEPDPTAGPEMFLQVVQKKFPLRHAPKSGHFVIVKADHESGYHIEPLSEIRERTKCLDLLNNAAYAKQACNFPKHRQTIHIKPDSGMADQLRDVEKVS